MDTNGTGKIVARLEDNAISLPIDVYTSVMQGRLSQQRFSDDKYVRLTSVVSLENVGNGSD